MVADEARCAACADRPADHVNGLCTATHLSGRMRQQCACRGGFHPPEVCGGCGETVAFRYDGLRLPHDCTPTLTVQDLADADLRARNPLVATVAASRLSPS